MCCPLWVADGTSPISTPQTGPSACKLRGKLSTLWSRVGRLTLCVCFSQLLFIFHLSEVGFQTSSLTWRVCLLFVVYVFLFVCTGSAADLCKMAMIRIFNLVSSSSSLSARYHL